MKTIFDIIGNEIKSFKGFKLCRDYEDHTSWREYSDSCKINGHKVSFQNEELLALCGLKLAIDNNGKKIAVVDEALMQKTNEEYHGIVRVNSKTILENIVDAITDEISKKANLNWLDVSGIKNFEGLFNCSSFNGDISLWDVSNAENMHGMFYISEFNGDLSKWDVHNVKDMQWMFAGSSEEAYRPQEYPKNKLNIGGWDVSSVKNMSYMFCDSSFNSDINSWNVSNVTDMECMFHCSQFNQKLDKWDIHNVKNMHGMFEWPASSLTDNFGVYKQDLSMWDISNVTDISCMFRNSYVHKNIFGKWDLYKAKVKGGMFYKSRLCGANESFSKYAKWIPAECTVQMLKQL